MDSSAEVPQPALIGPRRAPCASCPYRIDAPSGLWTAEEYDKLPRYDGSIGEQAMAGAVGLFFCHLDNGALCAGWVGCHDMGDNLAIRVSQLPLDYDAILDYASPVSLFASGAEAAEHGKRDITDPGPAARRKAAQLIKQRDRRESARNGSSRCGDTPGDSQPPAKEGTSE